VRFPKTVSKARIVSDVSLSRDWLQAEGYYNALRSEENVCLFPKEFRKNIDEVLGKECFRGRRFPFRARDSGSTNVAHQSQVASI
jgi:ribosome-binding factor A